MAATGSCVAKGVPTSSPLSQLSEVLGSNKYSQMIERCEGLKHSEGWERPKEIAKSCPSCEESLGTFTYRNISSLSSFRAGKSNEGSFHTYLIPPEGKIVHFRRIPVSMAKATRFQCSVFICARILLSSVSEKYLVRLASGKNFNSTGRIFG